MNSRYLNVLRMSFLGSDIPFDCALAYRPDTVGFLCQLKQAVPADAKSIVSPGAETQSGLNSLFIS